MTLLDTLTRQQQPATSEAASAMNGRLPPFIAGGFECSSHRRRDGVRLDLLRATRHDQLALSDYQQLAALDIRVARDGVRWHLVERTPGRFDWTSFLDMARAAHQAGVQVIWDLCHYGWPDHLDVWSEGFASDFAGFAARFSGLLCREFGPGQMYCPVNEISYLAWSGGDRGLMNPCAIGRGGELKRILARASIESTRAVRAEDSRAVVVCAEPLIHVISLNPRRAEVYRLAQFEALEMLLGRRCPELGGNSDLVDVVGVNFYPDNQWYLRGSTIPMGHHAYRPLSEMLAEVHARYGKPMFISETGAEGGARPYWLHYVAGEVCEAMRRGVPMRGICLYPIVDYPGWENKRLCRVGLLGEADASGTRRINPPLAEELRRAQAALTEVWSGAATAANGV